MHHYILYPFLYKNINLPNDQPYKQDYYINNNNTKVLCSHYHFYYKYIIFYKRIDTYSALPKPNS